MPIIHFKSVDAGKYKYELTQRYEHPEPIDFGPFEEDVVIDYSGVDGCVCLTTDGMLTVDAKYQWDGPSGPTCDTPDFMRGSLVHDCLYQIMRERKVPDRRRNRRNADLALRDICLDDGMYPLRADVVYFGLRLFGGSAAKRRSPG